MIFELTGGGHQQGGKKYVKGDRIETDRDLCKRFRGKFKLIEEGGKASSGTPVSQPIIPKTEDAKTEDTKTTELPPVKKLASGLDMTATFPEAKEHSLQIMKVDEDQFQIAKNGFIEAEGVFTRAEVTIYLKSL